MSDDSDYDYNNIQLGSGKKAVVQFDMYRLARCLCNRFKLAENLLKVDSMVGVEDWGLARVMFLCDTDTQAQAFEDGYWDGEDGIGEKLIQVLNNDIAYRVI